MKRSDYYFCYKIPPAKQCDTECKFCRLYVMQTGLKNPDKEAVFKEKIDIDSTMDKLKEQFIGIFYNIETGVLKNYEKKELNDYILFSLYNNNICKLFLEYQKNLKKE